MISDFFHKVDDSSGAIDFDKLQRLQSDSPVYEFYIARLWHKKVFIKRLKPDYRNSPFYLAALKKEYEIGVSLNHPSIPVYRDYRNGVVIIDYIEGDTLSNLIKAGKIYENSKNLKKIFTQLINVVDYLHQNNITHCDIKADNIIITKVAGNLILIDYDKCYTDSYDNTRANPENYGLEKNITVSSSLDFYQISIIIKEILPFVAKPDKRYLIHLISALQNNKVDPDRLRKIINQKFHVKIFFRNIIGFILLFLILFFIGIIIFKRNQKEDTVISEEIESYPSIEKEMSDSVKDTPVYDDKDISFEVKSEKVVPSNEPVIRRHQENPKMSTESLINRRMQDLLKPYAEYLINYDKAVENQNISYEELTSIAQGSIDMLVKSMERACNTLYQEFPELEKGEIQKIAWISPRYLELVNWNIEISERFGERVKKHFNQ